ncbi:hypothetical protein HPB51_008939 [Rhipicephalus microplus]|uniref:Uncharacterized protein n=1 Tax=Rhipicephalus microplus TaxID=6941 RepID=A0A9J6D4L7_RHIMP|nr:hypothetical protein HPB51_008939 [Rhipicephalus microplus]
MFGVIILEHSVAQMIIKMRAPHEVCEVAFEVSRKMVSEAFLRECRRDNRTYREQAVCYLAQLLQAQRLDRFGPLLDVLEGPLLKYAASRSGEAAEDDQEAFDLELQLQFQEVAFNALGQAWPQQAPDTQESLQFAVALTNAAHKAALLLATPVLIVHPLSRRKCTTTLLETPFACTSPEENRKHVFQSSF